MLIVERLQSQIGKFKTTKQLFESLYSTFVASKYSVNELQRVHNASRIIGYKDLFKLSGISDNESDRFFKVLLDIHNYNGEHNLSKNEYIDMHLENKSGEILERVLKSIKETFHNSVPPVKLSISPLSRPTKAELNSNPSLLNVIVVEEDCNTEDDDIEYATAKRFLQLRRSAYSRSKEFTLTLDNVKSLLTEKYCAYTGVEMVSNNSPDGSSDNPLLRSIDRFDPDVGYIPSNVYAVSLGANLLKERLFENDSPSLINIGFESTRRMMDFLDKNEFKQRLR